MTPDLILPMITKIRDSFEVLANKIKSIEEKMAELPNLKSLDKLQELLKETIESERTRVQIKFDQIADRMASIEKRYLNLVEDSCALQSSFDAFIKKFPPELRKSIENLESIRKDNDLNFSSFAKQLKAKNDSLREELKAFLLQLVDSKNDSHLESFKDLNLKVDLSSDNAKNAQLRSANNDMRLSIAEKKIEQLFLLLQRHQLNQ